MSGELVPIADHGLVEALPVLVPALILTVGVAFMVLRERRRG